MPLTIQFLSPDQLPADYASPCVWLVPSSNPDRESLHHAARLLARYLERTDVRLATTPAGRPHLPDAPELSIAIAHAATHVAVALTPVGQVGLSLEPFSWDIGPGTLAESYFTPTELAHLRATADDTTRRQVFYHLWTAKHAVLNALPPDPTLGLDQVEITPQENTYTVAHIRGARPQSPWTLSHHPLNTHPPTLLAVAVSA